MTDPRLPRSQRSDHDPDREQEPGDRSQAHAEGATPGGASHDATAHGPTRPASHEQAGAADQRDLLVSRIVDGDADAAHWSAFEALTRTDPDAWRELAIMQRQSQALTGVVQEAVWTAGLVDLPEPAVGARQQPHRDAPSDPPRGILTLLSGWSGWAVAAMVALVWFVGPRTPMPVSDGTQAAGILPVRTYEDAVRDYLELGAENERVLGEVPQRVLIDSRALDTSQGYEVIYIRQFVERAVVDDLMRFRETTDEFGRPVVSPATWPQARRIGVDG